ncbi:MAG: NAD(P)-binding domain-containing protein, partial [Vicinamibacteria bacterium]|nr:NAD(P)-binding domain-containing protein [Vicinamibacteria bacterium]
NVPFEGFERNPDVGGIWNIGFPGSPMYESAHFISSRTLSGFRDFPMPFGYPDYPSHRHILSYIESYAEHHDLRRRFRFGVAIEAARPDGEGGWGVRFGDGSEQTYAGLIAAVVCEWRPHTPEIPGNFDGEIIHFREYKHARQFEGRRVLVVGGGNSGCDIAYDASRAARVALLSLRRGYYFVPKHIFGKPADVFGEEGPHLPYRIERPILQGLLRLLNGDLTLLGLPKPDHSILESHPVMNTQILHALRHGDIEVRRDIREFRGRQVAFADGACDQVDLVVLATGYVRGVPFLSPGILADDDVSDLFLNVFHRYYLACEPPLDSRPLHRLHPDCRDGCLWRRTEGRGGQTRRPEDRPASSRRVGLGGPEGHVFRGVGVRHICSEVPRLRRVKGVRRGKGPADERLRSESHEVASSRNHA